MWLHLNLIKICIILHVTSILNTNEEAKYETYDINDQLCIHSIKELLLLGKTMIS